MWIHGAKVVRRPLVLVISIPLAATARGKAVRRPLVLVILIPLAATARGALLGGGGGGVPQAQAHRRS